MRRATLHNYEEMERKDVRIGDQVFIQRAGEVIPEVISVITEVRTGKEEKVGPPLHCPSCETLLEKEVDKVVVFCPNRVTCPAQTSGALKAFVGKHAANIDGLGDKIIDMFLEKGFITDFTSIYRLHEFRDQILELEGFEMKRTDNILAAIEGSRTMELSRFLLALGIPQIGRKTAKTLADFLASDIAKNSSEDPMNLRLQKSLVNLNIEALVEIRDIGPVSAEAIVDYFVDQQSLVHALLKQVQPKIAIKTSGGKLA